MEATERKKNRKQDGSMKKATAEGKRREREKGENSRNGGRGGGRMIGAKVCGAKGRRGRKDGGIEGGRRGG